MKILLFAIFFFPCYGFATNYYVDPGSSNKIQKGTYINPWISLQSVNENMVQFHPGDTIFFKRGERFIGKLSILCSGTPLKPIVFMPYGKEQAPPLFQYALPDAGLESGRNTITVYHQHNLVIDGFNITDTTINKSDHGILTNIGYGVELDQCSQICLQKLNISLVGIGVELKGDSNIVSNCYIHNLRMVVSNNANPYDDYGAVAIVLGGAHNKVINSIIYNCWGTSVDFGFDGGGIEIYGNNTNENIITGNTVISCNGFMEIGSPGKGSCNNTVVNNNILLNNGLLFYLQNGGNFDVAVDNLQCANNIIIENNQLYTKPENMIGIGPKHSERKGIILLKDNTFWLTSGINVLPIGKNSLREGQVIHENNKYFISAGSTNFNINKSESIISIYDGLYSNIPKRSTSSFNKIYEHFKKVCRFINENE